MVGLLARENDGHGWPISERTTDMDGLLARENDGHGWPISERERRTWMAY